MKCFISLDHDFKKEHKGKKFTSLFTLEYENWNNYKTFLLIEEELVYCEISTDNSLINCERGYHNTVSVSHSPSTPVYYVPKNSGDFYQDADSPIHELTLDSWEQTMNDLQVSYIYADGTVYAHPPEVPNSYKLDYTHKKCMTPYLNRMKYFQYSQYGEGNAPFDYFFSTRVASWDGVVFKNKEFTKNSKLANVLSNRKYRNRVSEFGWWKIHGSKFNTGKYDFDSTTIDDVHYVMSKVFFTDRSIGLQLSSYYQDHERIEELLEIMGQYHSLIKQDIVATDGILEKELKEQFAQPEEEFELKSNNNFIQKRTLRQYISSNPMNFKLENIFDWQKLKIKIVPKFGFKGFDDPSNLLISDFASSSSFSILKSSESDINCVVSNNGRIQVSNSHETKTGYCSISIPNTEGLDLSFKRGLGLDITGDSSNSIINVHVKQSNQWGYRDYWEELNFDTRKQLVLSDPTTKIKGYVDSIQASIPYSTLRRSWNFDWSKCDFEIILFVAPSTTTDVQLHSLKGLAEKEGNCIKNPTIKIGINKLTFPEVLCVNDSLGYSLEYDGNKKTYQIYNPNQKLLKTKRLFWDFLGVSSNENDVFYSSDLDSKYSQHAEILITTYGEEIKPYFNRVIESVLVSLSVVFAFFLIIPLILVLIIIVFFVLNGEKKVKTVFKNF